MRIHLLAMHRHETYPGQFGPEILAVVDEYTMEENPEYWAERVADERAQVGDAAGAWAELVIDLDTDAVLAALHPQRVPQPATVVSTTPLPGLLDDRPLEGRDPRIGLGSWVRSVHDDEDDDEPGLVTGIVDGGYSVIWAGDVTAKFAEADEVIHADGPSQRRTRA